MTTLELLLYYPGLLIYQYLGQPKAFATVRELVRGSILPQTSIQTIVFSAAPTSGTFVLSYNDETTSALNWNAPAGTIQTALRLLTGLSSVTVTGSISSLTLTVTFVGVTAPALALEATSSLLASTAGVVITISETDLTLPLVVQNAFNLLGTDPAVGVQLDVLGKYVGVSRFGFGMSGPITLSDADFLILIRFAIVINNAQSDLSTIVNSLFTFFGNSVLVFDYQNMHMSYLIDSSLGSAELIQRLIAESLLPAPMTVQVSVIYIPVIDNLFGFVSYELPTSVNRSPFNTYEDYQTDWPWLDYNDSIMILIALATEDGDNLVQESGDLIYLD